MGSCVVEMDVKSFQPKSWSENSEQQTAMTSVTPCEGDCVVEGLLVCLLTACSCRAYQDTWRRWDQRWPHCQRWDGYVGGFTSEYISVHLCIYCETPGRFNTPRCLISTALTNPGFFIFLFYLFSFLANIFWHFSDFIFSQVIDVKLWVGNIDPQFTKIQY